MIVGFGHRVDIGLHRLVAFLSSPPLAIAVRMKVGTFIAELACSMKGYTCIVEVRARSSR
jgi:hypothetical protein